MDEKHSFATGSEKKLTLRRQFIKRLDLSNLIAKETTQNRKRSLSLPAKKKNKSKLRWMICDCTNANVEFSPKVSVW